MDTTLKHDFRRFVKRYQLLVPGMRVLAAVSGGRDSMVLLHLLLQWKKRLKIEVAALHVNHQLRGPDSDADEVFVRRICREWNTPFFSRKVDIRKVAAEGRLSLEEAGHQVRENIFIQVRRREKFDVVATAHHRRDQAETILMRLLKGAGVEGLAGIRLRRPGIIRPMLFAGDEQIKNYCRLHNIAFREDKSNTDRRFLRNQVRHQLLPQVEQIFGASYESHLLNAGLIFQEWLEENGSLLDTAQKNCLERVSGNEIRLVLPLYLGYFSWLKFRLLDLVLAELEGKKRSLPYDKYQDFLEWLTQGKPGTNFHFDRRIVTCKTRDSILFRRVIPPVEPFRLLVAPNKGIPVPGANKILKVLPAVPGNVPFTEDRSLEFVNGDKLQFPLVLRNAIPGDTFRPLGMAHRKRVFDFLAEHGVRGSIKQETPILESSGEIVWVVGWQIDNKYKITKSTKSVYKLVLTEDERRKSKN